MATSGTNAFTLDLSDIIEEAYEQAGSELRSGYDYRTARRSIDLLMLDWQNRGLNLWTVKSASQALTSGTSAYTLSAEKLDVLDGYLRSDAGDASAQSDLAMNRISFNTYGRRTNKLQTGRPVQFYVEQADSGITVNLWPVPDSSNYVFFYYYMDRIEDSGKPGSNNMEVPVRFLPALTAGLAVEIAKKTKGSEQRAIALKSEYEALWNNAADASREKASWYMRPQVPR